MSIYCGNNSLHRKLLDGEATMGTPYACLRRGINIGLNQPYDADYNGQYAPIDTTRVYCGTNNTVPQGYDRRGFSHECHRIGIGVGKRMKASRGGSRRRSRRRSQKRSRKRRRSIKRKTRTKYMNKKNE